MDRFTGARSIGLDDAFPDEASDDPAISADGRYIVFDADATNLVLDDDNNESDIFIRDRETGTTERVSVSSEGAEAAGGSTGPEVTPDARYVAFTSSATNLVSNDTNSFLDAFVRDRLLETTERISVASDGTEGDGASGRPVPSADGRFVAFQSHATNLVPNDANGQQDVFVHDRETGTTERVSVASDGAEGNDQSFDAKISADGRFVVFQSSASNFAPDDNVSEDVFIHDREMGTTERVSIGAGGIPPDGSSATPSISSDGRFVAFSSLATNLIDPPLPVGELPFFARDLWAGETRIVSVNALGEVGNSVSGVGVGRNGFSGDGRWIAFSSPATNLASGVTSGQYEVYVAPNPFLW